MHPSEEAFIIHNLQKRVIEITYKYELSHLSSTLSTLPVIFEIYQDKSDDEVFILSNGHAGLALYVVLEWKYGIDAEMLLMKHGIHPSRDVENKIFCSTGSLGQGICVAVGHALADRTKNVYCTISDGEAAEGSIWEALRFKSDYGIENLKIYAIINGQGAYDTLDMSKLVDRLLIFDEHIQIRMSEAKMTFASGLALHYHRMSEEEYAKYIC